MNNRLINYPELGDVSPWWWHKTVNYRTKGR